MTPRNKSRRKGGIAFSRNDWRYKAVTPQAQTVIRHLADTGSITQREALMDHSVQSLTRRITELREVGYDIRGDWKKHPVTGQRYMRYSFAG